MVNAVLDREKAPVKEADEHHGTVDGILKDIIRQTWKEGVGVRKDSKEAVTDLDEHVLNMRKLLNGYNYEARGMPLVAANSSRMSKEDRRQYLANIEAIAIGYGNLLGSDLTTLILLGLPQVAKDHGSASRYTSILMNDLENRQHAYRRRVIREGVEVEKAATKIVRHSSGILRFFRRGKITVLKKGLERRSSRIRKLEAKADRYYYLLQKVKERSGKPGK